MSEQERFVNLVLAGHILFPDEAVDDYIQAWHESPTDEDLASWLGFTQEEYTLFVERRAFLNAILMARKSGISLTEAINMANDQTTRLAARGVPAEDIPKIREWLEQTGRL